MDYTTEELSLIFKHELTHFKRKDLWYKFALFVMRCLYWYNPIVHLMARQAAKDLETLCDYATVQGMDINARKFYGNLILRMAAEPVRSPLTTYMSGGKNMLKQRLTNILHGDRPTNKKLLITFGVALLLTGFFVGVSFNSYTPGYETENETEYTAGENESYTQEGYTERTVFTELGDELPLTAIYGSADATVIDSQTEIPIPLNMRERMQRRIENDLLPYADNYEQLHELVFLTPEHVTHTFLHAPGITINAAHDNVRVTQGGSEITISYSQWIEGQYILTTNSAGHVHLYFSVPYFNGLHGTGNYSRFFGNMFVQGDRIIHDGWLFQYLSDTGRKPSDIIEITIPEGMTPAIIINGIRSDVLIYDIKLDSVTINSSGNVQIENADLNNGSINFSNGNFEMRNTRFANVNVNTNTNNIYIYLAENVERYNITVSTRRSRLTLGGVSFAPNELRNEFADSHLKINITMGNVTITDAYGSTGSGESGNMWENFSFDRDLPFPDISFPDISFPGISIPDISFPDISFPDISIGDMLSLDEMFEGFNMPRTPIIGIFTMEINESYRDLFHLTSTGVMVSSVLRNSSAEAAGLQVRDIIVAFDGTPITNRIDLSRAMLGATAGQEIVLTVYRDGERMDITVTLGHRI